MPARWPARPAPCRAAGVGPGPATCPAAERAVQRRADPAEARPAGQCQEHDPAAHRQHHRQADTRAGALRPRGRRSEQVPDPAGEELEVALVDPGPVRRRVCLRARGDGRQPVLSVRVKPESAGDPAQPGHGQRIRGDDAQELLEGAAAGLCVAGEDLALGGPVAVRDHQRGDLGPQEDPAAHLAQGIGIEPAGPLLVDAAVPDEAADDGEPGEEQHQAHPRARRDAARRALDGNGRGQVERARVREPARLGQEILEGLRADAAFARAPAGGHAADPRPLPLAVHDRLEIVERGVHAPHERRCHDAGSHVLERFVELLRDGGRQHVIIGQGVAHGRPPVEPLRRHGVVLRLLRHECNRSPVDLPAHVVGLAGTDCHYGVAIWGWQGSAAVLSTAADPQPLPRGGNATASRGGSHGVLAEAVPGLLPSGRRGRASGRPPCSGHAAGRRPPPARRVTAPSHRAKSTRQVTGVRAGRGADEPSSEPAGSQSPVWREELDPETDGIAVELCVQPSQVNPGRVTAPSRRALVTPGRSRPAAAGRRGKLLRGAARAPAGQSDPGPTRRRSRRTGWVWLRRWRPRRGTPARPPGGAGGRSGSGLPSRRPQGGGRPTG